MRSIRRIKPECRRIAIHVHHIIRVRLDQIVFTASQSTDLRNRTRRIDNLYEQSMQSKKALLYSNVECQVLQTLESTDTQVCPCCFVHNISSFLKEKPLGKP